MASGINSTFRQVGIATGVAALGAIFQARIDSKLGELLPNAPRASRTRSPPGRRRARCTAVPPQLREQATVAANQAFISGLNEILLIGAAVAIAGAVVGLAAGPRPRHGRAARRGTGRRRGRPGRRTGPRGVAGANPSAPGAKTGTVLHELRIENLLLIERAELRLEPGLNAITGETGAGKTVLAHSLDLLMGGRARPQIVRPGADEAWVEGVFSLAGGHARRPGAGRDRRAPARRRRRGRARAPDRRLRADQRLRRRALRLGRRPARARRRACSPSTASTSTAS